MSRLKISALVLAAAAAPAVAAAQDATARAGVMAQPVAQPVAQSSDTVRRRPRAVEYSDWYGRRLTIHRYGSYVMLPLFAGTYLLGDRLLNDNPDPSWVQPTHVAAAWGTAALFGTNTLTGVWNLWDARHDPAGRTRRILHSAIMLASDAGFAYTGSIAEEASGEDGGEGSRDGARRHRNAALTSMGISTVGTVMMWLWRD